MSFRPSHDRASTTSIDKDLEKVEAIERYEHNKYANIGLSAEDGEFFDGFPEDKHKKMIRKVDVRLVPVLALLYLMAHIDRANIGGYFAVNFRDAAVDNFDTQAMPKSKE